MPPKIMRTRWSCAWLSAEGIIVFHQVKELLRENGTATGSVDSFIFVLGYSYINCKGSYLAQVAVCSTVVSHQRHKAPLSAICPSRYSITPRFWSFCWSPPAFGFC